MTINPNVRNVAIILVIAAVVAIAPGGGTTANVIVQVISLAFLASLVWVGSIMYREHRTALYSLGESRRTAFYVAGGVLAVTFTATARLWQSPGGQVAWLVLIGGAVYTLFTVVWAARRY